MNIESREHATVEVGSSRSFGIVFAVVFAVIGLYPLFSAGGARLWALAAAAALVLVAFIVPRVLQPLNVLWFRFGMLLGRIVNPVVMFVIYAATVVPTGLALRLAGKDLLRLKMEPDRSSYWIERAPPGPEPKSLEDLF